MKRRELVCALGAVVLAGSSLYAAEIQLVDPITGLNSGWQASFADNANVSLVIDAVTPTAVFIEKFVDFDQPPGPGGLFPAVNIDFTQTLSDSQTVPSIVILDEGLTNLTGSPWGGFNWLVVDSGESWFNVGLSDGFSTSPFNNRTFDGFLNGDPNRATILRASGGTVNPLATYFPGAGSGELWIDVNLAAQPISSFILKEVPVPEPSAIALLVAGLMMAVRRQPR